MKKKIMVIDDDESILEVMHIVLEGEGYDVETSLNVQPLQHLDGNLPDLILLDVLLSGEDGIEVCKHLKSQEKTFPLFCFPHIPAPAQQPETVEPTPSSISLLILTCWWRW